MAVSRAPDRQVVAAIAEIIREIVPDSPAELNANTRLEDIGATPEQLAKVFWHVEELMATEFPPEYRDDLETVGDIANDVTEFHEMISAKFQGIVP